MMLIYFWDASTRKVRAWVVASDGSWNQADVTFVEGAVRLDTKGALADGTTVSLISTLRSTDKLMRTEQWTCLEVGGQPQPDPPPIIWKRR